MEPDGLPSHRTDRTRANRTRLRQPEPSPRLLPLRATLRPLCRLPPLPPAHLIPSCHSESASAVRNLLLSLQPSLRGVLVSRHSCDLPFPPCSKRIRVRVRFRAYGPTDALASHRASGKTAPCR